MAAEPYRRRTSAQAGTDQSQVPAQSRERGVSAELIVGHPAMAPGSRLNPDTVEIATFGFMDPRGTAVVTDDDEWLWPKFIRVTMSLGDPGDKDIEQTYQVIFEVPDIER